MCADTYIALRSPLGSQNDHILDLEELNHYSWSYGIIFMVKIMHFWPKVHTRSTLYDRPSLKNQKPIHFAQELLRSLTSAQKNV